MMSAVKSKNSNNDISNSRIAIPKLEFAGFETGGGWGLGEQFARLPPAEDQLKQNKLVYKVARSTATQNTLTHSNTSDEILSRSEVNEVNGYTSVHEEKPNRLRKNKERKVSKMKSNACEPNDINNSNNNNNDKSNNMLENKVVISHSKSSIPLLREPLCLPRPENTEHLYKHESSRTNWKTTSVRNASSEYNVSDCVVHETQYNLQIEDDDNTFVDHGSGRLPWYTSSLQGKSTPLSSVEGARSVESAAIYSESWQPKSDKQTQANKNGAVHEMEINSERITNNTFPIQHRSANIRSHCNNINYDNNNSDNNSDNNNSNICNNYVSATNREVIQPRPYHARELSRSQQEHESPSEVKQQTHLRSNGKNIQIPLMDSTNRLAGEMTSFKSDVSQGSSTRESVHELISKLDAKTSQETNKTELELPLTFDYRKEHEEHKEFYQFGNKTMTTTTTMEEQEQQEQEYYLRHKNYNNNDNNNYKNNNNNTVEVLPSHSSINRTSRNEPQTWLPLHLLSRMIMTCQVRDMVVAPNGQTLYTAVGDDPLAVLELDGADLRVSSVMESVSQVYCMAIVRIPKTQQTTFKVLPELNQFGYPNNYSNTTTTITTTTTIKNDNSFQGNKINAAATTFQSGTSPFSNIMYVQPYHKSNIVITIGPATVNNNNYSNSNNTINVMSENNNNNINRVSTTNSNVVSTKSKNTNKRRNNEVEYVTLSKRGKAARARKHRAEQMSYEAICTVNEQTEESYVLWCGMARGTICVVNVEDNTVDGFIANAHSDTINKIWYLDNGKVWTAGRDKAIKVWDPQTRRRIKTRHIAAILTDMCYVHTTQQVWGIADDNIIRVYEAEGGNVCVTRCPTETVPNAVKLKYDVNLIACYNSEQEYIWAGMPRCTQIIDPLTYEIATSLNLTLSAITFHEFQAIFVGHGSMVESEIDRVGILDLCNPLQPAFMYLGNEIFNVAPIGIRLFTTFPLAIVAHEESSSLNKVLTVFTYDEMPPIRNSNHDLLEGNIAPQRQVNIGRRVAVPYVQRNEEANQHDNLNSNIIKNTYNNNNSNNNNNNDNNINHISHISSRNVIRVNSNINYNTSYVRMNSLRAATPAIYNNITMDDTNDNDNNEQIESMPESFTKTRIASKTAALRNNNIAKTIYANADELLLTTKKHICARAAHELQHDEDAQEYYEEQKSESLLLQEEEKENTINEFKRSISVEPMRVQSLATTLPHDMLSSIDTVQENELLMRQMLTNQQRAETPLADFAKLHELLSSYLLASPELLFTLTREERTSINNEYHTAEGKSMGMAVTCLMKKWSKTASQVHNTTNTNTTTENVKAQSFTNDAENEANDALLPTSRRYTLPLFERKVVIKSAATTENNIQVTNLKEDDDNNDGDDDANIKYESKPQQPTLVPSIGAATSCVNSNDNNNDNNNNNDTDSVRMMSEERAKSAAREEIRELSQCWREESEIHHKELQMLHRYNRQSLERNTALVNGITRIQQAIQSHLMMQMENETTRRMSGSKMELKELSEKLPKESSALAKNVTGANIDNMNDNNISSHNCVKEEQNVTVNDDKDNVSKIVANVDVIENTHIDCNQPATRDESFACKEETYNSQELTNSAIPLRMLSMSSSVTEIHGAIEDIVSALQLLRTNNNYCNKRSASSPLSTTLPELSQMCNSVTSNSCQADKNTSPEHHVNTICTGVDKGVNGEISETSLNDENKVTKKTIVTFWPINPLTASPEEFICVLQSQLNVICKTLPRLESMWNRVEDLHRVWYKSTQTLINKCEHFNNNNDNNEEVIELRVDFTKCKWLWDVLVSQVMIDLTKHVCILNMVNVLTEMSESNVFVATPLQAEVERDVIFMQEVYHGTKQKSQTCEKNYETVTNHIAQSFKMIDGLCVLQPYNSLSQRMQVLQLVDATSASLAEVFLDFESFSTRVHASLQKLLQSSTQRGSDNVIEPLKSRSSDDTEIKTEAHENSNNIINKNNSKKGRELLALYKLPMQHFDFMAYLEWVQVAINTIGECAKLVESIITNHEEKQSNNSDCVANCALVVTNNNNIASGTLENSMSEENRSIIEQKLIQWTKYIANIETEINELLTIVSLLINMTSEFESSATSSLPPSLPMLTTENNYVNMSTNANNLLSNINNTDEKYNGDNLVHNTRTDTNGVHSLVSTINELQVTERSVRDARYADLMFVYLFFVITTHYPADELLFVENSDNDEEEEEEELEFMNTTTQIQRLYDVIGNLDFILHSASSLQSILNNLINKLSECTVNNKYQHPDNKKNNQSKCE